MKHIKDLVGHASGIYTLAADNDFLFSGSGDGMLASWDLKSLEPAPFSVNVGTPIYSVALHENLLMVGQSKGGIHIINRATKTEERHLKIHAIGVFDLLVNTAGNQLYSAGGDGSLGVFDLDDFRLQMQIPLAAKKLRSLSLSPDGKLLLVSSSNGYIYVVETSYMNELYNFKAHDYGAYSMTWVNGNVLVTGGKDAHLRFWKLDNEQATEVKSIPAHNYAIYDIAQNGEGVLATASRDKIAKVWRPSAYDTPERLLQARSQSHKSSVNTVAWAGGKLFTAGDDRVIKAWSSSSS